jgi:sec-independent protein translocase protein TatB
MFNIGAGELALIFVIALLVLGPTRLPELARGIGKFIREFRRQTDEVRSVVEREFYRMDEQLQQPIVPALIESAKTTPPPDVVASNRDPSFTGDLTQLAAAAPPTAPAFEKTLLDPAEKTSPGEPSFGGRSTEPKP